MTVFVQLTARYAIHLRFDISANDIEIRALQIFKCIVWRAVDLLCGYRTRDLSRRDTASHLLSFKNVFYIEVIKAEKQL
jgi:hypothetical protein